MAIPRSAMNSTPFGPIVPAWDLALLFSLRSCLSGAMVLVGYKQFTLGTNLMFPSQAVEQIAHLSITVRGALFDVNASGLGAILAVTAVGWGFLAYLCRPTIKVTPTSKGTPGSGEHLDSTGEPNRPLVRTNRLSRCELVAEAA